jgi:acyl-coenzyme A thioesterase PaaI-like protein
MAEPTPVPEIPDDWLNDTTDYQRCFVCGERNEIGMHVHYHQEGDRIVTSFTGDERHQGYPGVVHGGLLATLLDETLGRTGLFGDAWVMTGKLEVRYRAPAPIGVPLKVSGWATRRRRDAVEARGEVELPDGTVVADARGLFLRVPDAVRQQAADAHPELGKYFNGSIRDASAGGRK